MKNKIILGLSGRIASGKETVGKYLMEKYGAEKIRFSDPLRQTLRIFNLPTDRKNMQDLSTILRQNFGENILAEAMLVLAKESKNNIVIVDGVRRLTDISNFKTMNHFFLLFIDASPASRYKRYVERGENPGEAEMTREEFDERDNAEAESQIESLKEDADFILDNNGTLEELYNQVEKILNKIKV